MGRQVRVRDTFRGMRTVNQSRDRKGANNPLPHRARFRSGSAIPVGVSYLRRFCHGPGKSPVASKWSLDAAAQKTRILYLGPIGSDSQRVYAWRVWEGMSVNLRSKRGFGVLPRRKRRSDR